jgi:hypothetical protein
VAGRLDLRRGLHPVPIRADRLTLSEAAVRRARRHAAELARTSGPAIGSHLVLATVLRGEELIIPPSLCAYLVTASPILAARRALSARR